MHKGGGTSNIKIVIVPDASTQIRNLTRADIVYVSETDAPLFKYEDQKKFAHPYYWAPFILIGNWL
jgi:CHAT domain-containing protein